LFSFLTTRPPPKSTQQGTLPYTTLFRSPRAWTSWPDLAVLAPGYRVLGRTRSEEHTSELQSRLVTSYAVVCLKKKKETWGSRSCPASFHASRKASICLRC